MTKVKVNGAVLDYTLTGAGSKAVVFAHGLLIDRSMFDHQVGALQNSYRCIAYDHRGQGRSEVTAGGYDMDSLTADAAALLHALDASPCHFVGLSMGGFVGLRLAIRHPELLRSLTLIGSAAGPEPRDSARQYRRMTAVARWIGLRPLTGKVMPIMFGRTFLADSARAAEREHWRRRIAGANRRGIVNAARGVIDRAGVDGQLDQIQLPVLVIVGEEDLATPVDVAQDMCNRIPGARLVRIPGAGHSATIEQPARLSGELAAFLAGLEDAA